MIPKLFQWGKLNLASSSPFFLHGYSICLFLECPLLVLFYKTPSDQSLHLPNFVENEMKGNYKFIKQLSSMDHWIKTGGLVNQMTC